MDRNLITVNLNHDYLCIVDHRIKLRLVWIKSFKFRNFTSCEGSEFATRKKWIDSFKQNI